MLVHIIQNILAHKIQVTFTVESLYLKLGLLWFYDHSYFVVTHFLKALTVLVLRTLWTLVPYFSFISKLDIFSLMCAADKAWITEFTLIHKILGQFATHIHKCIVQSDVKRSMMSPIKTIRSVLKVSADSITNSQACPIGRADIIADNGCLVLQNWRYSMCYMWIHWQTTFILCPCYKLAD